MKIDATKQKELLASLEEMKIFIESLEVQEGCISCINWQKDGCKLANFQRPPDNIVANGCEAWQIFDEIPY
jgi:hypothetical protein